MNQRSGIYKTNLSGDAKYKSFLPIKLPPTPTIELDNEVVSLLASANRQLGMLDGISTRIPNVGLFVSMYVRKEALLSSQI